MKRKFIRYAWIFYFLKSYNLSTNFKEKVITIYIHSYSRHHNKAEPWQFYWKIIVLWVYSLGNCAHLWNLMQLTFRICWWNYNYQLRHINIYHVYMWDIFQKWNILKTKIVHNVFCKFCKCWKLFECKMVLSKTFFYMCYCIFFSSYDLWLDFGCWQFLCNYL